jgi:hypothetical protein
LVAGQSKIFSQKAEPTEPRDRTFDVEQQYAQAIADAAQGKPVDPQILSAAKARQSWNKEKQPPPSYQILPAEGGYTGVNPKAPGQAPIPVPGVGGAPRLLPEPKPVDAGTKRTANQAWVIIQTGEDLKKMIATPEIKRELGILAGRKAEDWDRVIGSMSPAAREIYSTLASFYSLQGMLHQWRAIRVKAEFEKAIGGMAQSPEALQAGIQSMQNLSQKFLAIAKKQGYNPGSEVMADPFDGVSNQELFNLANSDHGDQAAYKELKRRGVIR